jgi:hypothetical protein
MTQPTQKQEAVRSGQPREQEPPDPAENQQEQNQKDDEDDEDSKLDEAIDMTFPASDPISI